MAQRDNAPRTQRERLDTRRGLQPTARPQASYDNARPAYAERPYGAGREMESLARSLSQFDNSLGGYLGQRIEKQIEEDVANGLNIFTENTASNKNMQDWKTFTEANPQHVNVNPWVKKGYEQARLQALGLDYEKGMNDAFVQSELVNEKDQTKVDTFFQEYDEQFREQHGLNQYEDKIMLASNFTKLTATAKQGLYSRHSQYLQSQNEMLLGQQYSDLAVKAIDNMFDQNINGRTRSFANAHQHEENMDIVAATIMQNVQAATEHGYTNAKAADLAAQMVFTAADKAENPIILEALDHIQINGVTLSSLPNVAAKVEQREQQRVEKQRADTRWYWAQQERQEKLEEKQILNMTFAFSQTMYPATEDKIRQWEQQNNVQIPRRLMGQFMKGVNEIHIARETAVNSSPLVREELANLRMRLNTGQPVSPREVMKASVQTGDEWFINTYANMDKEENTVTAESMKTVGTEVWKLLTKADEDLFMAGAGDQTELEASQKLGLEAKQLAHDILALKLEDFARGNHGVKPTPVQRRAMERKVVEETYTVMKKRQAALREKEDAKAKREKDNQSKEPSAWEAIKNVVSPPTNPALDWLLTIQPNLKDKAAHLTSPEKIKEFVTKVMPERLEELNHILETTNQ